ncbi:hypothetical protein ILYODFUR_007671 [Ilyodon furcidens]|uniref:Uncharacterized protein n=1 Tax=Ilyodon furcidens TaxID=33524 RepID=A0ABV0UPY8_9TELE
MRCGDRGAGRGGQIKREEEHGGKRREGNERDREEGERGKLCFSDIARAAEDGAAVKERTGIPHRSSLLLHPLPCLLPQPPPQLPSFLSPFVSPLLSLPHFLRAPFFMYILLLQFLCFPSRAPLCFLVVFSGNISFTEFFSPDNHLKSYQQALNR